MNLIVSENNSVFDHYVRVCESLLNMCDVISFHVLSVPKERNCLVALLFFAKA
jgi:hypothetical protein